MSQAGNQHGRGGEGTQETAPSVRVVLVGRSEAERTLRRMREVELVRAREPLSAIGEVANPIDSESPMRTVVLVAPGAVAKDRVESFAAGIRRADPSARIVSLGESTAGFDGVVPNAGGDASDLLAALAGLPHSREAGGEPARKANLNGTAEKPAQAESDATSLPVAGRPDDAEPVVGAMLRGGDAIETAMRGVRERLGVPNAAFVSAVRASTDTTTPGPSAPPTGGVAVRFGDRVLGYLVAPRADRAMVEAEAAGLAPWVALAVQQDQLKRAAFTDELTGAWNRRYFGKFLGAAIERAREARHSVAVLYFDLDNFKIYNDKYGHAAGDEILVETVKLLRSVIRPSDRVCRIGGDEFAVIFYDPEGPREVGRSQSPSEIGPIARRFQQQICKHKFPKLGGEAPGTLTISGGMAAFPWDGADVSTLLDRADQLALQSKSIGKNAITLGPGAERVCSLDGEELRTED